MYELKTNFYKEPFEFFVFENFFSESQLKDVWSELDYIVGNELILTDNQKRVGTAENPETGEFIAKRHGIFLEHLFANFRDHSKIYKHMQENFLNSSESLISTFPKSTLLKYLPRTNSDGVLISLYNPGDYYKPHADDSIMTLIIYLWKGEKTYEGGELSFVDEDLVFEPSYNEAILFPSCHRHEVLEIVSSKEKQYPYERIAISMFVSIKPVPRF